MPFFQRSLLFVFLLLISARAQAGNLHVGTALIDVTPAKLPVLVNGGMTSRSLDRVKTRVHARALVFSDGQDRAALVVVDSCMIGRVLLDEVKALAAARTGIAADHILISATHAHSAPASMGCLGTDADPDYVPFLRNCLVEAIERATSRLQPARIGFARTMAPEFTALRQWIRRPDRIVEDPFGNQTVRANMHAGANLDDVTGEAGPEDPELSLICIQTQQGKPLAVLANFSMHYFGDSDISADYFGLFADGLKQQLAPDSEFIGIMSHGCSGDIWRRDYRRPETWDPALTIDNYAAQLVALAVTAYRSAQYEEQAEVEMAEERLPMKYRTPNTQLLEWSQKIMEPVTDRLPKDQREVYAREQLLLHAAKETQVVVQALRVGSIGIATTPTETYAVTGLKIKAASPLQSTMVIELANGGDGYIPPPEQYAFGGYNTWAARSAGLQTDAEPRIAQAAIRLLEKVSGQPRRSWQQPEGPAGQTLQSLRPVAWWRLDEFNGPVASDSSGKHRHAVLEPGITFSLEGPDSAVWCGPGILNRCPQFVGGRLAADFSDLGSQYSLSLWFWNGMPDEARPVAGWLYSRDHDNGISSTGEHLGIGGSGEHTGRLMLLSGDREPVVGSDRIARWTWAHLALVRDGDTVSIWLNGKRQLQVNTLRPAAGRVFLGGRSDAESNWEGRLDEAAIFDRALTSQEISVLSGKAQ